MNIHLADSLEEFDLQYIESCNQCFSDDSCSIKSRSNSISSKTSQLTLLSPLLNNSEEFSAFPSFYSKPDNSKIPIFNDKKLKLINKDSEEKSFPIKDFKRPPLKPSLKSESTCITSKKNFKRNLGNPFYKPPPPIRANSTTGIPLSLSGSNSPTKKRRVSINRCVSSFDCLVSLSNPMANDNTDFDDNDSNDNDHDHDHDTSDTSDSGGSINYKF